MSQTVRDTDIVTMNTNRDLHKTHYYSSRDRLKFGFGFNFGAETDLKCSFCSVSVTVTTPHFTFGFGRNYTTNDRNWSE